jgi:magnesium-transporting ATPase (P-type)
VGILTQRYNRVLIEQDGLKGTKLSAGLSTAESQERLRQHGPNRVEEERRHPLLTFLGKFWAPVPWMLEATIALGILVHKLDEAVKVSRPAVEHEIHFPQMMLGSLANGVTLGP